MKLAYVDMCGFRGYQKPVRIDFAQGFTIIDGRNGVGKSTIFDAVEFALTGTISKYLGAKASGQTVDNYIWWSGLHGPAQRYVEVGFCEGDEVYAVRRTPKDNIFMNVGAVTSKLYDSDFAPKGALGQLCAATIIRDEHIARLSLDLKEGERFTLLRDAIGAVDADDWIARAQRLSSGAQSRVKAAQSEVDQANFSLSNAVRQIDQVRSSFPVASLVGEAEARLQIALQTQARADQLADVSRRRLVEISTRADLVESLFAQAAIVEQARSSLPSLNDAVVSAGNSVLNAATELQNRSAEVSDAPVSSALAEQARRLESLVNLGHVLGLRDGHCPLCASDVDHAAFEHGLQTAIEVARQLDARAVEQAQRERARDIAQRALDEAQQALETGTSRLEAAKATVATFDKRASEAGLTATSPEALRQAIDSLEAQRLTITADLRLLDTGGLNQALTRAGDDHAGARERVTRFEAKLGRARLAEARAKAIYDAARRAAAETLDQRLDRVLPLMCELYKRLRPHPIWGDIEYSVRGDVQRFLKLQVGDDINPQFVFSSGQRRATGLAFLLSINLSIAWSRWRSILLDDPVQHVDDFRTVHLAEVLAHLCQGGRQIICAVEDSALADLMCRRLPATTDNLGKRVKLGTDSDGALSIVGETKIIPFNRRTLVVGEQSQSA